MCVQVNITCKTLPCTARSGCVYLKSITLPAMKKRAIIALTTIVLAGCFSSKKTTSDKKSASSPTQEDVNRVASKFPGYTLTELNEGKALYETQCGECHALYRPTNKTEAEWQRIVPVMVKKINSKGMVLNNEKQDKILRYLITMSGH